MAIADYSEPVSQLLTQGEPKSFYLNYSTLGITEKDIPDLIRMATDDELYELDIDAIEGWGPVHAWRALGRLKVGTAVLPLLEHAHQYDDNEGWQDWTSSELPTVFSMIGAEAISPLAEFISDRSKAVWTRITAVSGLEQIIKAHPETRSQCVEVLQNQLAKFEEEDPELNGFIIYGLATLRVMEALPLIEQAFAADRVDLLVGGDWDEIQVLYGLKQREGAKPAGFDRLSPVKDLMLAIGLDPTNHQNQKGKKKTKRKQQSEARRKNRKRK